MTDIDKSLDEDQVITRYMSFAKFYDLITSKKLFLSKLSNFDDPHEGSISLLNAFIESGFAAALDSLVNKKLPTLLSDKDVEPITKFKDKIYYDSLFGKIEINSDQSFESILMNQRNWIDAYCWHMGADESLAMWLIYGSSSESICIETTVKKLSNNLIIPSNQKCLLAPVQYINHKEDLMNGDCEAYIALHKKKPYSYEKEIRLVLWDPLSNIFEDRVDCGSLLNLSSLDFITNIRLSPKSPTWFQNLIKKLIENQLDANLIVSDLDSKPIFGI